MLVSLVTRGSPGEVTGGHLYHRQMAAAARRYDAEIECVSASVRKNPLQETTGVPLVDSLVASIVAPWVRARPPARPIAAIVHQPPGGIGHGAVHAALQARLDRSLYRRSELLIVVSQPLADELVDEHGLPTERMRVIEPGCDLPATTLHDDDLRRGRRVALLCVANWTPSKGILELLDALGTLADDHATLHLVGRDDIDPAHTAQLRARLRHPDVASRVVVHGVVPHEHLGALYAGVDAFVLPSYIEAYGIVYGEALAAGLPTIGWRSGNLPHLIDDGREGCLVDPGDVRGLAAALERLSTDVAWRGALAAAARQRGQNLPTWDAAAGRFFAALRPLGHLG